jgi:hypothetical protein
LKRIFALLLAVLMLMLSGCGSNIAAKKDGSLYVMTSQAKYDSNGLCYSRIDHTYDSSAQLLKSEYRQPRFEKEYNAELDAYTYTYNQNSPLELNGTVTYSYDDAGNYLSTQDAKMLTRAGSYTYAWTYQNGLPESYTPASAVGSFDPVFLSNDGRNITARSTQSGDWQLWDYDTLNRLVRERSRDKTGVFLDIQYKYDGTQLTEVLWRQGNSTPTDLDRVDWDAIVRESYRWTLEYDRSGNLVKLERYNTQNELTQVRKFTYNSKGFPTGLVCTDYLGADKTVSRITYDCDSHGNITKVTYPDGTWEEFTYQAMNVTPKQEQLYRQRLGISFATHKLGSPLFGIHWQLPYYSLIPNPWFCLPHLQMLMHDN